MRRTDRIWEHTNAAFAEANKAFAEAEHLFAKASETDDPQSKLHRLRFAASSRAERWRLARKFFQIGWRVLRTGKAQLHFKLTSPVERTGKQKS